MDNKLPLNDSVVELMLSICARANVDFKKSHHSTPLRDVNSAVNGGLLLLALTTVDANNVMQ